jgi:MFS family permease
VSNEGRPVNSPATSDPTDPPGSIYGRVFWLAYVANVALVTANALTFRFAELIKGYGGSEATAGAIVSVGMIGALALRLFLGRAIDRFGVTKLWLLAAVSFVVGCLGFLLAGGVGWPIYAARIAFCGGLAGMFTCSMVHVQNLVPAQRRTEVIAALGSSGFVGMFVGTQLGDGIFALLAGSDWKFWVLFGGSALLGLVYAGIVIVVTRGERHERPASTPAIHDLLLRHWPGMVLLVACQMGVAFTVISVFLTRFCTVNDLGGIAPFFFGYTISAFWFRVQSRNWSRTMGRHRMVLLGCGGQFVGCCLFPFVTEWWHLVVPSIAMGFGHALLFPAVVSLGVGAFPREYRGTGTTLILGFTEVGAMFASPILGLIIDHFGANGFGFTAMFLAAAGSALVTGSLYALTAARTEDEDLAYGRPPLLAECAICGSLVPDANRTLATCPVCATSFVEPLGTDPRKAEPVRAEPATCTAE